MKAPLVEVLMNLILVDVGENSKVYIRHVIAKWVDYICIVMLDGWTTTMNRAINFLGDCERQTIFMCSFYVPSELQGYGTI